MSQPLMKHEGYEAISNSVIYVCICIERKPEIASALRMLHTPAGKRVGKQLFILSKNLSAIGVKAWYFFHTKYSFVSSLGKSGLKTSPLSGDTSISLSNVKRYPSPAFANIEPL